MNSKLKSKSLKICFQESKKNKKAIGQFNFSSFEQIKGIVEAAKKLKAPVILGASEGEINFFGIAEAISLRNVYRAIFPYIYVNLDHGKNITLIKKAIDEGFDSVHFDGSQLPLKDNIKKTKEIVKYAHRKGCLVEGEIKSIKGGSIIHKIVFRIRKKGLEDVGIAKKFVKETGVDSLAINIGNIHGTYRGSKRLNINLLKDINKKISAFLVLHGGSATNQKDIKKAIKNGVVKININTETRIIWRKSLEKSLRKDSIKPYEILTPVVEGVKQKIEQKIKLFSAK